MSDEQAYDPLSQAQKHIMLRNATFEFEFDTKQKQSSRCCCCNHSIYDHLDCTAVCLAKSKELCICERFMEKGVISPYIPKKKLPYQRKEQEQLVVKDGKITQDDQGKFMRQYGII